MKDHITYTPTGLVRTAAGIVIGGAYSPPSPQSSADADYLQRVLMDKRHDAAIRENRARHECAMKRVIYLDSSLLASVLRAVRIWIAAHPLRQPAKSKRAN